MFSCSRLTYIYSSLTWQQRPKDQIPLRSFAEVFKNSVTKLKINFLPSLVHFTSFSLTFDYPRIKWKYEQQFEEQKNHFELLSCKVYTLARLANRLCSFMHYILIWSLTTWKIRFKALLDNISRWVVSIHSADVTKPA